MGRRPHRSRPWRNFTHQPDARLMVCTLSLAPLAFSGVVLVISNLVFAAVLWGVVAVVAVATRGQFSRQPLQRWTA
ncbi:MAG: hypothetical protein MI924_37955 [Chloroflexales bacterium]|nr:hypothetical protein [Chloroflexales bacterium]